MTDKTKGDDNKKSQAPFEWKKGVLLGRGGFGSVYLGLTDSGEMIAYTLYTFYYC